MTASISCFHIRLRLTGSFVLVNYNSAFQGGVINGLGVAQELSDLAVIGDP